MDGSRPHVPPYPDRKPQGRSPGRRTRGLVAAAVLVVAVVVIAVVVAGAVRLAANIDTVDLAAGDGPAAEHSGSFNVLVVGSDGRDGQGESFGEGDIGGARNDVTMVLHVNEAHTEATVLSIPRDLLVDFPDCRNPETGTVTAGGAGVPFNEALGRGGLPCTVAVAESLTDLDIQYAASMSFQGMIDLSNAVGGVPMCFAGPIDDPDSGLAIPAAGTYDLKGEQALAVLRSRHGVGDGSDLARISSQQAFASSLMRKLQDESTLTNIPRLYAIAEAATRNTTLSSSLADLPTLVALAGAFRDIPLQDLNLVTYPYIPAGNRLLPDTAAAQALMEVVTSSEQLVLGGDNAGRGATAGTPQGASDGGNAPAGSGDPAGHSGSPAGATPDAPAVPENVEGQNAAQGSCIVPYSW